MIQTPPSIQIPDEFLVAALGAEITAADLMQVRSQIQILTATPGQNFWHADDDRSGIYVLLSGKIRLFDRQDRRVATLTAGKSFGASSLFPAAEFQPYTARAALVVGGVEILVGFIPAESVRSLWGKYPTIQADLSHRAQYLDGILRGEKVEGKSTNIWQLFQLIQPHRVTIGEIFLASIVLQIFGVISPIFTQLILDRAIVHRSESSLAAFGVGLLIFGGFQIAMRALRQYLMAHTANRIDAALLMGFMRHAFSLPLSYFDSRHVGDIISRIRENHKIQSFITGQSLSVLLDLMSVFVYATLMFVYSWKLALVTLISIPPFLILTFTSTPFLKRMSREVFNATNDENSYLIEALNGVRTIKSMSVERSVRWNWEERLQKEIKQTYRGQIMNLKIEAIGSVINTISSTALIWIGAALVISGEFTIGQLFAFNMLSANVISPFQRLAGLWNKLQEIGIAIERLGDVLEAQPEEDFDTMRQDLGQLQGYVKFTNVTFRYRQDAEHNILENISFDLKPGQTIALVGRSGSGKTTLSKLILGLYKPTSGSIEIDGKDINTISFHSLRSQIGIVDQDTFLFSGTVKDNITLAKPGAKLSTVRQAARMAGADEFIDKMPMRYDTEIGEGGSMLSGGQRQRLAIARALLNNPRLLIFDEATSSLDTESERIIQNNLEKIRRDRSTIIIAHRLSTVRNADLILVLDKGILIESGNHQQLMERRGQYYYLTQQQAGNIQE